MRDIWAVPPGGFEATAKKSRKGLKAAIAGGLVVLLGVGIGTVVSSMNSSTEVGEDTALAEFRENSGSSESSTNEDTKVSEGSGKPDKAQQKKDQANAGAGSAGGSVSNDQGSDAPGAATGGSTSDSDQGNSGAPPSKGSSTTASSNQIAPPREGVYSWEIDGYEEAPGVHRQLPKRSSRIITHEGNNNWTEHHIFSEQREQWFGLGISEEGVFTRTVRNRVEFGPVEEDATIVYNPPMFVSRFPMTVNNTWDGSWKGKTSGEYQAKCFERGFLTIGGERVEVFATEVKMEMRGEVEGTATVRSWVSPEHRLVVKQYQETRVTSGPGDYHSEWTGQLTSLDPKT
ncbi:MAG TPA: hypothetical protein VE174_01570 [Actinomycetota bacterium]|nr:hypothetical protein [Actinomycetota bacterium]